MPSQSDVAWERGGVVTWGPASTALVTLLEVEVSDGVAPTSVTLELGESKRLVSLGRCAQEPAREGGRLEAGGEPRVPLVEGEAPGLLGAAVKLHDVHWLREWWLGPGYSVCGLVKRDAPQDSPLVSELIPVLSHTTGTASLPGHPG